MKISLATSILFSILVFCVHSVSTRLAREQVDSFDVPSKGCEEVTYTAGGSTYRVYPCDMDEGPCVYAPHVEKCPNEALGTPASYQAAVSIDSRRHAVRYYRYRGSACLMTPLKDCCTQEPYYDFQVSIEAAEDCRCEVLPTGEKICDPIDCDKDEEKDQEKASQQNECRCINLPTGERICDPINCDQHRGKEKASQQNEPECRCITLPTGERICDPIDCDRLREKEKASRQNEPECRCMTLPNGERICDPIDCNKNLSRELLDALLNLLATK